ncbi:MAG: type II toxin-antitoxin system RelE/ParE family toxin [bacterium]
MHYKIRFKPRAIKDGKEIPHYELKRILGKIEEMENDLYGDIKHLTNYTPEYRLRVGDYRVLFEIEGDEIVIYRIRHRKEIYR